MGLGRAPRSKRGKYVVKINNAIIYINSHRLENSKTLFTLPKRMTQNSFKTLQEDLLLVLDEKLIDDEEFAVLYEEFTPQNLPFRHWDYEKFSLENKDPAECKADFRFEKSDISLLVDVLQMIPSHVRMVPFVIQQKEFVLY